MWKLADKLNKPAVAIAALAFFLVVDGLLFYRYWLTTEAPAESASSPETVLAANREDVDPGEQGEPKETDDEAEQSDDQKEGVPGTAEDIKGASNPAPDLPTPAQRTDQPTPVAADDAAVFSTPVPAQTYPEPFYEQEGIYEQSVVVEEG